MEKNTALQNKIYLLVPFEKKDSVKKLGAKWDPENKGWYIDHPLISKKFNKWLPEMYKHSSQPPFIRLNFFPMATSGHNVRSTWKSDEWDAFREQLINLTGNRCTICGEKNQNPKNEYIDAHCHEHWEFEIDYTHKTGIQRLKEFTPLCQQCHDAVHINILRNKKEKDSAYEAKYLNAFHHLCAVNRWQDRECELKIEAEISQLKEYQDFNWKVDISLAVTLYKTLLDTELSNTITAINCYKNSNKDNDHSTLNKSDDFCEAEEHSTLSIPDGNQDTNTFSNDTPKKKTKKVNDNKSFLSEKVNKVQPNNENIQEPKQIIKNINLNSRNIEKLLIGLIILILGTYVYFSISRPSEGPQTASLPPKTVQPVYIDNPPTLQKNMNKPKSTQEKPKNQYRKCEPVRGQPGAKMCQDHNGQWHLIKP